MDFLENLASGPLLALLAIPLAGAVIFTIIIVVNLSRRNKKSQMKLGIQPKKPSEERQTSQQMDPGLNTSVLSPSSATPEPELDLNTAILASVQPGQNVASDSPALTTPKESEADSGPGHGDPPRSIAAATSPPVVQEEVDPAARLKNQPAATPPPRPESVELMRLSLDADSGALVVEVGGHRYVKLTEVTDKRVGQYILKLAAHLLAFTNGMIETEAGLKSVYNPRVGDLPEPIGAPSSSPHLAGSTDSPPPASAEEQSEPPPAEGSPYVPKPSPEAEAAFLASLRAQTNLPEQPRPRGGGLFRRTRPGPQPILPSLNLAEEINRIVQARLLVSPLAATTDIEITDDLSGGIRIKVNGVPYPSPDDVPDPDARALIKASIKQWERS